MAAQADGAPQYLVSSAVWEDETFNTELSEMGQRVWFYLLFGRCRTRLPGLILSSPIVIAERIGRVRGIAFRPEQVSVALEELIAASMVQADWQRQLLRVPNAPKYASPPNTNILGSWFRIWRELPKSQLKYDHLQSLWSGCVQLAGPSVTAMWKNTFGSINRQDELFSTPPAPSSPPQALARSPAEPSQSNGKARTGLRWGDRKREPATEPLAAKEDKPR